MLRVFFVCFFMNKDVISQRFSDPSPLTFPAADTSRACYHGSRRSGRGQTTSAYSLHSVFRICTGWFECSACAEVCFYSSHLCFVFLAVISTRRSAALSPLSAPCSPPNGPNEDESPGSQVSIPVCPGGERRGTHPLNAPPHPPFVRAPLCNKS